MASANVFTVGILLALAGPLPGAQAPPAGTPAVVEGATSAQIDARWNAVLGEITALRGQFQLKTYTNPWDGKPYTYYLFQPPSYQAGTPAPLVLFYHGAGAQGFLDDAACFALAANQARFPCFVAVPQFSRSSAIIANQAGNWSYQQYMVRQVLGEIRQLYTIDPARLFAAGFSAGGNGSLGGAIFHPSLFAGVISASGASILRSLPGASRLVENKVGVLEAWGAKDSTGANWFRAGQPFAEKLRAAGADVTSVCFPDADHPHVDKGIFTDPALIPWILNRRKDLALTAPNHEPIADCDYTYTTAVNTARKIHLTASDPNGDALTFTHSSPGNGTLSGTAPRLTYTPKAGFVGMDSFTFQVSDGGLTSNVATVTISVGAPIPTLNLKAVSDASEPSTPGRFSISLQAPYPSDLYVDYAFGEELTPAAIPGVDFVAPTAGPLRLKEYLAPFASGRVKIPANTLTVNVDVVPIDNPAPGVAKIIQPNLITEWGWGNGQRTSLLLLDDDHGANAAPVITGGTGTAGTGFLGIQVATSGTSLALNVTATDDGGPAGLTYGWSVLNAVPFGSPVTSAGAVTFAPNGTIQAGTTTATFSAAGTYTIRTTVTDAGGLSATRDLYVYVSRKVAGIAVTPAAATVPASGTQQFAATASDQFGAPMPTPPSVTWSVSGGGTISAGGLFSAGTQAGGPFTVKATSGTLFGSAQVTVSSTAAAPTITGPASALAAGTVGSAFTATMTATGTAPIAWSLSAGSLPPGITLNPSSGVYSGTPTTAGIYSFTVRASNAAGSDSRAFSQTINPAIVSPAITGPASPLPAGTVGAATTTTFAAAGTAPITWSVSAGSLPPGIALNSSTGVASGTPTAAGTFTFTVKAANAAGSDTRSYGQTINPAAVAPSLTLGTTLPLQGGIVGSPFSVTFTATGTAPLTWSALGSLPPGITLNPSTGVYSGMPTTAGVYGFTLVVTNSAGSDTVIVSHSISSASSPTPRLPVAHWALDEPVGPTSFDSVGTHDGDWFGSPVPWAAALPPLSANGPASGALRFDGSGSQYVQIPSSLDLENLQETSFTAAGWALPADVPPGIAPAFNSGYTLIAKQGGPIGISYRNDQTWRFDHWAAGGAWTGVSSQPHPPGVWRHVAAVWDRAAGEVRLYVDGVLEGNRTGVTGNALELNQNLWRIGIAFAGGTSNGTSPMKGAVDDVRLYDYALTPVQIGVLAAGVPPPTGLVATVVSGPVDLSWVAPSPPMAYTYSVYRSAVSQPPGGYGTPIASGLASTSYSDATAVPGTAYFYVVRASSVAQSGDSNEAAAGTASAPILSPSRKDHQRCGSGAIGSPGPTALGAGALLALALLILNRVR
jgi:PKD repeat protein/predicted esterase